MVANIRAKIASVSILAARNLGSVVLTVFPARSSTYPVGEKGMASFQKKVLILSSRASGAANRCCLPMRDPTAAIVPLNNLGPAWSPGRTPVLTNTKIGSPSSLRIWTTDSEILCLTR